MNVLTGKKTYTTVAVAFAYLLASKFNLITFDQTVFDGFLAAAIAFLRSGVNGGVSTATTVTTP